MVQSVDRAVSVLEFLSREGWSGVTEVANGLNVHKSTAHRLLVTLKERGLVEQDVETEHYRLGLGLVFLASAVQAELDVVRSAGPVCQRLHEQTQETVTISVLAGDEVIVVYQTNSSASVFSADWKGRRLPLHCTSDGKVLLAHHPDRWQRCIATRPLERFTAHTIVDPARLQEQMRTIRVDGYGYTVEELEVGLNAVAAPIYSADGTVVATIGVSGPTFRLPATSIPEVGELARSAAAEISRRLGFEQAGGGRRKAGVEDRLPSSAFRLPPSDFGEVTERS